VLLDGRVLIAGGSDGANPLASVEVYDPATDSVAVLPAMSTARGSFRDHVTKRQRVAGRRRLRRN